MSCDACSSSKTKCDQTRPVCVRCQKNGLQCNYSISQRKGKPPAASRDPSHSASGPKAVQRKLSSSRSTEERTDRSGRDSRHAAVEPTFDLNPDSPMMDMSLAMPEDVTTASWQSFVPDLIEDATSDLSVTPSNLFDPDLFSINTPDMGQSILLGGSSDDLFNLDDDFPGILDVGPQPTRGQAECSIAIHPLPTPAPSSSSPQPTPAPSNISPLLPRYDCTRLASSTIDSLNLNSQTCTGSLAPTANAREPNMASLDQILIANRTAVENAHKLLSCPCALSQQSNLILSLIIDKILALYQTIIRTDLSATQLFPSAADAGADKCLVRDTPITIGAYKMDAQDERRMRMQLVSNELRKAAALVDKYADKYAGLRSLEREDTEFFAALTSLLRRRLKKAVDDIVAALRNS